MTKKIIWLEGNGPRSYVFPYSTNTHHIKRKRALELAGSEHAKVMFDILRQKKVTPRKANHAVLDALSAAADHHQLATLRLRQLPAKVRKELLGALIESFRNFTNAISALPPDLKGILNVRIAEITVHRIFDTEVFIELLDCIEASLSELSRTKLANEALLALRPKLAALHPETWSQQALPIAILWESIPSIIRSQIERKVESKLPTLSGVETVRFLLDLLQKSEPASRRGTPVSVHLTFARRIDSIWLRLKLTGRRCYDEHLKKGTLNPESAFQAFCNAALAAVGNEGRISRYQISHLKKRQQLRKGTSKALNNQDKV
jgi:hypothetical protein